MIDTRTRYLDFELPHPIVPGSSPLTEEPDHGKRLEDAGAPLIIMDSLFEEDLARKERRLEDYLDRLRAVKEAVDVPVVASLNGSTPGGWVENASVLVQAGADALELNVYDVAADFAETGDEVERRILEVVGSVTAKVNVPVAVKLSPYYTALPPFARRLSQVGARALVLFNRFYQADFDLETRQVTPALRVSDSSELLLRLRWTAILAGRVEAYLAVTGGVHTVQDVVKAVLAGADVVQTVSALLQHGPERIGRLRRELAEWLEAGGHRSLAEVQGSLSLLQAPDPTAFERANYVAALRSWGTQPK